MPFPRSQIDCLITLPLGIPFLPILVAILIQPKADDVVNSADSVDIVEMANGMVARKAEIATEIGNRVHALSTKLTAILQTIAENRNAPWREGTAEGSMSVLATSVGFQSIQKLIVLARTLSGS
jgi:hypothetical protein